MRGCEDAREVESEVGGMERGKKVGLEGGREGGGRERARDGRW